MSWRIFNKARPLSVGIFGFGNVGRELSRQVKNIEGQVGLVADSSAILVSKSDGGFNENILDKLYKAKENGESLSSVNDDSIVVFNNSASAFDEFLKFNKHNQSGSDAIIADCSAYSSPEDYLLPAIKDFNLPVALANKKPITGKYNWFESLHENPDKIRIESTCGAGLPVICTLDRLHASGDCINKIEGQLSGTLGFILSELENGRKFSEIVVEAVSAGYAEPDPRDDLCGLDVARKALILARKIGRNDELDDIKIEALFPDEMASLTLDTFMKELPSLDPIFEEKISEAKANNTKLRYCATVEPTGSLSVGLRQVPNGSPLAGLKGTDNLVSFTTNFYSTNPLVVVGPGAGLKVTAGGVLADIKDLHSLNK